MNIEHISVSRAGSYENCNEYYKYKYHLKIPNPGPEFEHFIYGKFIHKIIEEYTKNRGKKEVKEIIKEIQEEGLEGKKLNLSSMYKKRIQPDVLNFLKLSKKIGYEGEVEKNFSIDLDEPNKKLVVGFIDRLINLGDRIVIIDYKTTKQGPWRKTPETVIDDLQLQCYCWVAMREFNLPAEKISAGLYYLLDGQMVAAKFSTKTLEELPKKLLKIYNEISESDPSNTIGNVSSNCNRCEYRDMCPFFATAKKFKMF